jgi:hypothetical protein
MANIFKTTLKKDIIADIANNNKREIRFPITKFWATRFADKYNLDERTFVFKTFDSLEFSSPSNKDTGGEVYIFDLNSIFVDGDEFVVLFKDHIEIENCVNEDIKTVEFENNAVEDVIENATDLIAISNVEDNIDSSDVYFEDINEDEILYIDNNVVFTAIKQWFDDENILDDLYESVSVIATNVRQIIILPNGKVLGSKKVLPVNNDVEVRVEFDMDKRVYFDATFDIEEFKDDIFTILNEIRKNNFVFVWKRYTGIFIDNNGIYFGIKYSTRKSIGFNRKYNVQ